MQLYRRYDTGDTRGDEVLRFKIKNKFCYAAYFEIDNGNTTLTSKSAFTFYNTKLKHQLV